MSRIIDADSHFMEPLDLWERYIDPKFRSRCLRFERFPRLRVATIESGSGWVVEWMDRLDYRYSYMGHSCAMKRPASEYFARNIWISADPTERLLPYMVELAGEDKFFIGSDFPHAEGFVNPIVNTRKALAKLPELSINKVLGDNAAKFFGV